MPDLVVSRPAKASGPVWLDIVSANMTEPLLSKKRPFSALNGSHASELGGRSGTVSTHPSSTGDNALRQEIENRR